MFYVKVLFTLTYPVCALSSLTSVQLRHGASECTLTKLLLFVFKKFGRMAECDSWVLNKIKKVY